MTPVYAVEYRRDYFGLTFLFKSVSLREREHNAPDPDKWQKMSEGADRERGK